MRILVAGGDGFVGRSLVRALVGRGGHAVRAMVRDAQVRSHPASSDVDTVFADVLDPEALEKALVGVEVAYYLIHALGAPEGESREAAAATAFVEAASNAGVSWIIYLGGILGDDPPTSGHLGSRARVGEILRSGSPVVTEFRASVILGPGSPGFEMLQGAVSRLPVIFLPAACRTRLQPIARRDVVRHLVEALDRPGCRGRILEIGGREVLSYRDLMRLYLRVRGVRRFVVRVPGAGPRLSSWFIGRLTGVPQGVALALVRGMETETIVRSEESRQLFDLEPLLLEETLRRAITASAGPSGRTSACD